MEEQNDKLRELEEMIDKATNERMKLEYENKQLKNNLELSEIVS